MQKKINEKVRNEYLKRTRKPLETKQQQRSHQRNKHLGSSLVKYSGPFFREQLRHMDYITRKLMTMHKTLNKD